jgi:hypothetical protein
MPQRKVPVCFANGSWRAGPELAETFPCDFAIVLDYRDADQGFLGTLSCNGSCVTCVMKRLKTLHSPGTRFKWLHRRVIDAFVEHQQDRRYPSRAGEWRLQLIYIQSPQIANKVQASLLV